MTVTEQCLCRATILSVNYKNSLYKSFRIKISLQIHYHYEFSLNLQAEIIATCRDNIICLESVLRGPTGTVLSAARGQEIRGEFPTHVSTTAPTNTASTSTNTIDDTITTIHTSHTTIIVHKNCQCVAIDRFIGSVLEFLLNWTNCIINWPVYRYLLGVLKSLLQLLQGFAKNVRLYRDLKYLPW